jgi:hypothetical protein
VIVWEIHIACFMLRMNEQGRRLRTWAGYGDMNLGEIATEVGISGTCLSAIWLWWIIQWFDQLAAAHGRRISVTTSLLFRNIRTMLKWHIIERRYPFSIEWLDSDLLNWSESRRRLCPTSAALSQWTLLRHTDRAVE